jgi:hypothetical protein
LVFDEAFKGPDEETRRRAMDFTRDDRAEAEYLGAEIAMLPGATRIRKNF